jgi:hypothetical protein
MVHSATKCIILIANVVLPSPAEGAAGAGFDYLIMDSALTGYLPLYLTPVLYLL